MLHRAQTGPGQGGTSGSGSQDHRTKPRQCAWSRMTYLIATLYVFLFMHMHTVTL
jgi:hypothetical protein